MPGPELLTGAAPAKVNLVLEVLGRRPDGYHEIDTILQTLALADEVRIQFGGRPGVTVAGPFATGVPTDETNLAWRAAADLARRCGQTLDGLGIRLEKFIPAAGGLGGGASDAATTLQLLARAWDGVTAEMLAEAANAVGSDEAFFLVGGTARAQGRGERVTPLGDLPPHGVVLFIPGSTTERKTARLFAALDSLPFDDGAATPAFSATTPATVAGNSVFNTFERVAFDIFPGLRELHAAAERLTGDRVHLAGAGPTLFWIGPLANAAEVAVAAAGLPCTVIQTLTAASQWR